MDRESLVELLMMDYLISHETAQQLAGYIIANFVEREEYERQLGIEKSHSQDLEKFRKSNILEIKDLEAKIASLETANLLNQDLIKLKEKVIEGLTVNSKEMQEEGQ